MGTNESLDAKREAKGLRKKAPKEYTEPFSGTPSMACMAIGTVRSPYKERFGTPFQASAPHHVEGEHVEAFIEVHSDPRLRQALDDLEGFDYVWVLAWMHLNQGWRPKVSPPRAPGVKRGLFSTRSPHRPNPLSMSALQLLRIEGRRVYVRGIDLLDGTPVLDLKPYLPYADAFPNARAGWVEEVAPLKDGRNSRQSSETRASSPPPE